MGAGHTRETERIKEKMNICSRSESGRDRRDGHIVKSARAGKTWQTWPETGNHEQCEANAKFGV